MTSKALPQPAKPNKEVQKYVEAFSRGGRLVMPDEDGRWRVIRPDDSRVGLFETKEAAVVAAEQELAGTASKVFVFDQDGELVGSYRPRS